VCVCVITAITVAITATTAVATDCRSTC